jgi:hypothetical protein
MPLLNMGPGCARWSILIDDNALNLGTDILNYFDDVFSSSIHPSRRTRYKIEFEALDPMSRPRGRTWDRQDRNQYWTQCWRLSSCAHHHVCLLLRGGVLVISTGPSEPFIIHLRLCVTHLDSS